MVRAAGCGVPAPVASCGGCTGCDPAAAAPSPALDVTAVRACREDATSGTCPCGSGKPCASSNEAAWSRPSACARRGTSAKAAAECEGSCCGRCACQTSSLVGVREADWREDGVRSTSEAPLSSLERTSLLELEARATKRFRMLAIELAARVPVYERSERWVKGSRHLIVERGSPLVWHPGHGCHAPVEDQDAVRADAIYRRETITEAEHEAAAVTTTRLLRIPRGAAAADAELPGATMAQGRRPLEERLERAVRIAKVQRHLTCGLGASKSRDGAVTACQETAAEQRVTIRFSLVDESPVARVPSRQLIAASAGHRAEAWLRDRRSTLLGARRRARLVAGREFEGILRASGGHIVARFTQAANLIVAEVPLSALEMLAGHPAVANLSVERPARPDAEPDATFLCTGRPDRQKDEDYETASCRAPDTAARLGERFGSLGSGSGTMPHTAFLDSKISAISAWPYLDNLYDGGGPTAAGGLAPWATGSYYVEGRASYSETSHLVVGVIEKVDRPDPLHPAFLTHSRDYRVRYYVKSDNTLLRAPDYRELAQPTAKSHGTSTAGVALANITDGQDSRVTGSTAREARSGLARRAYAVFSEELLPLVERLGMDVSADIGTSPIVGGYEIPGPVIGGIDIVIHSECLNDGCWVDNGRCPDKYEARGMDDPSLAVVTAFIEQGVLYVKSAGNGHGDGCESCVAAEGYREGYEVSSPAASAAAVSVGAMSVGGIGDSMTPMEMQSAGTLHEHTSGGVTDDGRTFPLLVASHFSCGVANSYHDETGTYRGYGWHNATSAAAPTVGGAATLFKHWYLDHAGSEANEPGRLMSNLLNFADGYARESRASGSRVEAPAPAWGLGRFRMRYFDSGDMSFPWGHGTTALTLTPDALLQGVQLSARPLSSRVGRLRITLWWLEVNTGDGQEKASFSAGIVKTDEPGSGLVAVKTSGSNNVIRFDFDCRDPSMAAPPTGDLLLYIVATNLPVEEAFTQLSSRVVYVSWFWEGEQWDASLIDCGDEVPCSPVAGPSTPDVLPLAQERSKLAHLVQLLPEVEAAVLRSIQP